MPAMGEDASLSARSVMSQKRRQTSLSDSNEKPAPKKRNRPSLNCAECKRLKIKCDRDVPCGSCVKRDCADVCPDGLVGSSRAWAEQRQALQDRVHELESRLMALTGDTSPEDTAHPPPPVSQSQQIKQTDTWTTAPPPGDPRESSGTVENSGTLYVARDGRSTYLGPTGNERWHRQEERSYLATSRDPSPEPPGEDGYASAGVSLFGPAAPSFAYAAAALPLMDECVHLVDCFYSLMAWGGASIAREDFQVVLDDVYLDINSPPAHGTGLRLAFQRLSQLFTVIACGRFMSSNDESDDPVANRYFNLARQCLASGQVLSFNTLTAVQTIDLMASFAVFSDLRGGSDLAWQLRGVSMRIAQAMGLYRDGRTWSLTKKELNMRRRTFWHIYWVEVLFARTLDRPSGMPPNHIDTAYPDDWESDSFQAAVCDLAKFAKNALDVCLNIPPPAYARILEIWAELGKREMSIPFRLRCRPAMTAMVSRMMTAQDIAEQTPDPSTQDRQLTWQQHTLAVQYSYIAFGLLRPYFINAIASSPLDPTKSPYADAYLAAIERSSVLVAILRSLYELFPATCARQWMFWTHAFAAAVCLATVCIVTPSSPLVDLCTSEVDTVVSLFTAVAPSQLPMRKDLEWLRWLRDHTIRRIHAYKVRAATDAQLGGSTPTHEDEADDQLALLGWRTRLMKMGEEQRKQRPLLSETIPVLSPPKSGEQWAGADPTAEEGVSGGGRRSSLGFQPDPALIDASLPDFLQEYLGLSDLLQLGDASLYEPL